MKCHSQECLSVQTNFIEVFFSKGVYFSMDKQVQRSVHFLVMTRLRVMFFCRDQVQRGVFLCHLAQRKRSVFQQILGLEDTFSVVTRFRGLFVSVANTFRQVFLQQILGLDQCSAVETRFTECLSVVTMLPGIFYFIIVVEHTI